MSFQDRIHQAEQEYQSSESERPKLMLELAELLSERLKYCIEGAVRNHNAMYYSGYAKADYISEKKLFRKDPETYISFQCYSFKGRQYRLSDGKRYAWYDEAEARQLVQKLLELLQKDGIECTPYYRFKDYYVDDGPEVGVKGKYLLK